MDESSRGVRADCGRTIVESTGGREGGRGDEGEGRAEDGVKGSSPRQFVVKSELIF